MPATEMQFLDGEPEFMSCKENFLRVVSDIVTENHLLIVYCFVVFYSEKDKITLRNVRTRMD